MLAPALIFLDGVELSRGDSQLLSLDPAALVCIEVMKGSVAVRAFGERARSGVRGIVTEQADTSRCR